MRAFGEVALIDLAPPSIDQKEAVVRTRVAKRALDIVLALVAGYSLKWSFNFFSNPRILRRGQGQHLLPVLYRKPTLAEARL